MRLFLPPLLLVIAMSMTGCWTSANEFMREPFFSPVGSGLVTDETASIQSAKVLPPPPPSGNGTPPSLYSQPRIANVGDIVRVLISMNDKATLGNASGRSQTTKDSGVDRLWLQQRLVIVVIQPASQTSRRPLVLSLNSGYREHRSVRADSGVGGGGRHPCPS